jgi:hypothetical protein
VFYPSFRVLPFFPRFTLFFVFYPFFRYRFSVSAIPVPPVRSVSAFYPYPVWIRHRRPPLLSAGTLITHLELHISKDILTLERPWATGDPSAFCTCLDVGHLNAKDFFRGRGLKSVGMLPGKSEAQN